MVQLRPDIPLPRPTPYRSTFNKDLEDLIRNAARLGPAYRKMREQEDFQRRFNESYNNFNNQQLARNTASRELSTVITGQGRGQGSLLDQIADAQGKSTGQVSPELKRLIEHRMIPQESWRQYGPHTPEMQQQYLLGMPFHQRVQAVGLTPQQAVQVAEKRNKEIEERGLIPEHLKDRFTTPEAKERWARGLEYKQKIVGSYGGGTRVDAPLRDEVLHGQGALASTLRLEPIAGTLERANRFVFRPLGTIVGAAIMEAPAYALPPIFDKHWNGFQIAGRNIVAPRGTTAQAVRSGIEAAMTDEGIDLDAAISAFHDQFNALPGFWGAVEAVSSLALPPFAMGPLANIEGKLLAGSLRGTSIPARALLTPKGLTKQAQTKLPGLEAEIAAKGLPEWAKWKGKAVAPYSAGWNHLYKARPDLAGAMDEYIFRLETGIPTGAPAPLPGTVSGDIAQSFSIDHSTLKEVLAPGEIRKFYRNVSRIYRESITDRFAGIEWLEENVRHFWRKTYQQELPDELRGSMMTSLIPGAPSAALHRTSDTLNMAKNALKTKNGTIHTDDLKTVLVARHHIDIVRLGPGKEKRLFYDWKTGLDYPSTKGKDGAKIAEDMIAEIEQRLGPEQMASLNDAAKIITDHYADILKREVASGRISQSKATAFRERFPNYNPIGYQDMDQTIVFLGGPNRVGSKTWTDGYKRLGESGLKRERRDPFSMLEDASIKSAANIARNDAARSIVHMAEAIPGMVKKIKGDKQQLAKDMGVIEFREQGKIFRYEVPEWMAQEAKRLELTKFNSIENVARMIQMPFKGVLTQYNPAFMAANTMVDTLTVWTMRGVSPWRVTTSLLANMKNIFKEDPIYRRMIDAGGDVSGWHGKDPRKIFNQEERTGNIVVRNARQHLNTYNPLRWLSEIGHAMEMAPRRAVFKKAVEKGNSDMIAAVNARRSTVDFDRAGNAIRSANNFFLYLNPAVQGALLPYRAMRSNPVQFGIGAGGLAAAAIGIYANNRNYAEYFDIPIEVRMEGMIFMLPSTEVDKNGRIVPHYIRIVPNIRELAAFTAPFTYAMERLDGENQQDFDEFVRTLGFDMLNPIPTQGKEAKWAWIPTEVGQTIAEFNANKNFYTGRPIIPENMLHLPKEEQYDEYTSLASRRVGKWLNISPMQLDHVLEQGVLRDAVLAADGIIRAQMEDVDPEAEAIAIWLQNMAETAPQEKIAIYRREVLNELDPEMKEKVLEVEKTPEPAIPFYTTMKNRFYGERSGELYRLGLRKALEARDMSEEDYYEFQRKLDMYGDKLESNQYAMEMNLERGWSEDADGNKLPFGGKEYRAALANQSALWGALQIQMVVTMPDHQTFLADASTRAEFYNDVFSLVNTSPDKRSRSAILYSTFKSIPIPDMPGTDPQLGGEQDWRKHNAMVDEFRNGLSEEDQTLLELEIQSRMTPFHRENFYLPKEQFKYYWHLEDRYLDTAAKRQVYTHYIQMVKPQSIENRENWLLQNPNLEWVVMLDQQVESDKIMARTMIPELEEFLLRWDYISAPVNPDVKARQWDINPAIMTRLQHASSPQ